MEETHMPVAFFGHGSPMNAIEHNHHTEAWHEFGRKVGRPRAVVVVSAHWLTQGTLATAMSRPRTIHDFYGFPSQLFDVQYPAPGSPEVADELVEVLSPTWVGKDMDSWGLDHGTWSVLCHMFPEADVPVVQLSIDSLKSFDEHFALGAALAPLATRGVLVVGSGNVVHNLGRLRWDAMGSGDAWAERFDQSVREIMAIDPSELPRIVEHPDYSLAVPTPEHFIPLLYVAGLASAMSTPVSSMLEGCTMGSLSMTSYATRAG